MLAIPRKWPNVLKAAEQSAKVDFIVHGPGKSSQGNLKPINVRAS